VFPPEGEREEMDATRRQINVLKSTNEKEKGKAEEVLNEMKWGSPIVTKEVIAAQNGRITYLERTY